MTIACPFLTLQLRRAGDAVELTITGPDEAAPIIAGLFAQAGPGYADGSGVAAAGLRARTIAEPARSCTRWVSSTSMSARPASSR
jgi:hypothetical protein